MNGKPTFQKSLRRAQRSQATRAAKPLEIGNWRLEENSDGDLVVTNLETQETTILIEKNVKEV